MKKRISDWIRENLTLCELLVGIVLFGMLCQIAGCILLREKLLYHSIGLWFGTVIAIFTALHMNASIQKVVELDADSAEKVARKNTILRYFTILIILGIVMALNFANPLTVFLGIMGLKIAAYCQPLIRKIFIKYEAEEKVLREENISSEENISIKENIS